MNIFITGGTGEIGTAIVESYLNSDCNIIILTRSVTKSNHQSITYLTKNVNDLEIVDFDTIDIVVHAAAVINSDNIEDFININIAATKKLIKLCEEIKIKKFILISSMAVGAQRVDNYASTKRLSETYLIKSNLNWLIIRPAAIYGKNTKWEKNIQNLINKKFYFSIGFGNYNIYQININDCAKIIKLIIDDSTLSKTIFYISEAPLQFKKYLFFIKNIYNLNFKVICLPYSILKIIGSILLIFFKINKRNYFNDPSRDLAIGDAVLFPYKYICINQYFFEKNSII